MNPIFASIKFKLNDLNRELTQFISAETSFSSCESVSEVRRAHEDWIRNSAFSGGVVGLYTGMEAILKDLLSIVDRQVPSGDNWHQVLIEQASEPVQGLRPAIISETVTDGLMKLRGFRHFERHNYRFKFEAQLVEANVSLVKILSPVFIQDILTFIASMSNDSAPILPPRRRPGAT